MAQQQALGWQPKQTWVFGVGTAQWKYPDYFATYPKGTAVEVKWKGDWYPARVLAAHSGIHHIQYDDSGPEWNERVALKRIRLAK